MVWQQSLASRFVHEKSLHLQMMLGMQGFYM